jgi:hypothetical protein
MVSAKDWPDDSVEGNAGEVTANPAPDTCAEVTVTDEPDTDSITFCVAVAPTCVGLKLIVALFEVIVPTVGRTETLPLTPPEHPVISTTETANTKTIEFALLDQRFIRLTMRHHPARRGFCAPRSSEMRK